MINFSIRDAQNAKRAARVTASGELAVAPLFYDEPSFQNMGTDNQIYNFYEPRHGQQLIITGVLAYATKDVNDASATTIEVFSAISASAGPTTALLTFGIGSTQAVPIVPLNIKVAEGFWVNGRTDDDDVQITIFAHYVPRVDGV